MSYIQIVDLVIAILLCFGIILICQYFFFVFLGLFFKKKFPKTDKKLKYGIIIGARNEEKVISNLLDSISRQDYPKDKITTFVIAHNCTDKTAAVVRNKGAICYEYNNSSERTVGYAYKHLFSCIEKDYKTSSFDAFIIINADNILTKDYVSKMNDAYVANKEERVITSYRNSINFGDNVLSCMYGLLFLMECRYEFKGRTVCDSSARVFGTGYVFNSKIVKDGWNYVTLTEDWEFSADQVANGSKVIYCDEAMFYDEQPTTLPVMYNQRLRWARGHLIVFFTRFKKLVKAFFEKPKDGKKKNLFSIYDMTVSIMPIGFLAGCIFILRTILYALGPIFGENAAQIWATFGWTTLLSFASGYIPATILIAVLAFLERKKIGKVNPFIMGLAVLLWPLFGGFSIVLDFIAIFKSNLEWKAIPHNGGQAEIDLHKIK